MKQTVCRVWKMWKGGFLVLIVRSTIFNYDPKFKKSVKDFGPSSAAGVIATIHDFEFDWRSGMEEDDLFAQYNYKSLKYVFRPYKIFQIYVGQNRKNPSYRAELIFYDEQSHACWVYAFKKDPNFRSKKQDIALAVVRADEAWHRIIGR